MKIHHGADTVIFPQEIDTAAQLTSSANFFLAKNEIYSYKLVETSW